VLSGKPARRADGVPSSAGRPVEGITRCQRAARHLPIHDSSTRVADVDTGTLLRALAAAEVSLIPLAQVVMLNVSVELIRTLVIAVEQLLGRHCKRSDGTEGVRFPPRVQGSALPADPDATRR